MPKIIKYWDDARASMFQWIEQIAKTVIITMGPKWRNVILGSEYGRPVITNDWVTIAKEIELEDIFENMWAELVKEAAEKTNNLAWDGTTTATLLTYALAKEWMRNIKTWVNAVELKNGMKKAWELIVQELEKNTKKISTPEEIAQVASISAQDSEVWDIIAEAMRQVWNDGVITVEEGQSFWMEVEITEWMEFENGYLSPYMVSNTEKMLAEIQDALILITDKKISTMKEMLPILEQVVQSGKKDLVIIAESLESEALTALILNKLKWAVNVLAIKAPWFGEKKKDILKDIAILTWANLIADELGMKIENVTLSDLWYAANVIASQENTTIISWAWESSDIESRVSELKKQLETTTSKYDWEKLIQRIAKLAWWVAVIKVWAASETEMKERKLRIEDALNATRAAVEEGVVAWGWVALLRASVILQWISLWNSDQDVWAEIVLRALSYPLKQIVENAWKEWSVVMSKILENDSINFWYNASDDTYVDMLEIWIVDPKKVARIALTEAISLAWMFLTTESAVWELPGKKDNSDMWAGWMWGWYPGMWMM